MYEILAIAGAVIFTIYKWATAIKKISYLNQFFNPNSKEIFITDDLPESTYKMSSTTKESILNGKSYIDKISIIKQINIAENKMDLCKKYFSYVITYSKGYYTISYGLIEEFEYYE